MIQIFSPIDSRGRKKAILKCIAEIKKQYKVKETKKYLLDKLNNLSDLNYIKNISGLRQWGRRSLKIKSDRLNAG